MLIKGTRDDKQPRLKDTFKLKKKKRLYQIFTYNLAAANPNS